MTGEKLNTHRWNEAMDDERIFTCIVKTPLGAMQAAAKDNSLLGLWFMGQKYFPQNAETWIDKPDCPVFTSLKSWLKDYFAGKNPKIQIPLSLRGTDFQQAVWKLLLKIPYGRTTAYGTITERLKAGGVKASAQAVGGAVGHNPISILVPCHRVLGANGSLTGYAGGLEKKQALLELEGAIGPLPGVPRQPDL